MEPAIAVNKLLADLANRGADPGLASAFDASVSRAEHDSVKAYSLAIRGSRPTSSTAQASRGDWCIRARLASTP